MSDGITIRPARRHECEVLSDLARRSKAVWGYGEKFMRACHDELTVTPVEVDAGLVFVAEEDGAVLGVHALEPTDTPGDVHLGLLFVEPGALRRGIGAALFRHARAEARRRGWRRLLVQGDPHAEAFYLAMGATRIGDLPSASIPGRTLPLFAVRLDTMHP